MLPQKENRHSERLQTQLVFAPSMVLRAPWIMPNVGLPGLPLNMQPCCRTMHLSIPPMLVSGQPVFGDHHHWNDQFCDVQNLDNNAGMPPPPPSLPPRQRNVTESSNSRSAFSDGTESCSSPAIDDPESDAALLKFQKSAQMHGIAISSSKAKHESSKSLRTSSDSSVSVVSQPQIININARASVSHSMESVSGKETAEEMEEKRYFGRLNPNEIKSPETESDLDGRVQAAVASCRGYAVRADNNLPFGNFTIEDDDVDFQQNDEDCEYFGYDLMNSETLQVADSWTQTDVEEREIKVTRKSHMSTSTDDLISMVDEFTSMEDVNIASVGASGAAASADIELGRSNGEARSSNAVGKSNCSSALSSTDASENDDHLTPEIDTANDADVSGRNPTSQEDNKSVQGISQKNSRNDTSEKLSPGNSEKSPSTKPASSSSADTSSSGSCCNLSDVPCCADSSVEVESGNAARQAADASGLAAVSFDNSPMDSAGFISLDLIKKHLIMYNPGLASNPLLLENLALQQMNLVQQERLQLSLFAELMRQRQSLQMLSMERSEDAMIQSQHQLASQMLLLQHQQPFAQQSLMAATSEHIHPLHQPSLYPQNLSQLVTPAPSPLNQLSLQLSSVTNNSLSSVSPLIPNDNIVKATESTAHQVSNNQETISDEDCLATVQSNCNKKIYVIEPDHCENLVQLSPSNRQAVPCHNENSSCFNIDHDVGDSLVIKPVKMSGQHPISVSSSSDVVFSEGYLAAGNSKGPVVTPKYQNETNSVPLPSTVDSSAYAFPSRKPIFMANDKRASDVKICESGFATSKSEICGNLVNRPHNFRQISSATDKQYEGLPSFSSEESQKAAKGTSSNIQERISACSLSAASERNLAIKSEPTERVPATFSNSEKSIECRKAGIGRGVRPKGPSMDFFTKNFTSTVSSDSFRSHENVLSGHENAAASKRHQYGVKNELKKSDSVLCGGLSQNHLGSRKNVLDGDSVSESRRKFNSEKGSYVESWMKSVRGYQHCAVKVEQCSEDWVDEAQDTATSWIKNPLHYSSRKVDNSSTRVRPKNAPQPRSDDQSWSGDAAQW